MMNNQDFESISLQWQETIKILIQSFNKILNKYLTYNEKTPAIVEKIYEKSFYLFRITNKSIFNEVSIVIKNLLNSNLLTTRKKQTLLEEIEGWLKRNKNQGQAVHDMMNVIIMVSDDPTFTTDRVNFELILRIYIEIVYFAAFSTEYSTYFYNLELMCKAFMKKLFTINVLNEGLAMEIKEVFVKCLPELLVTKVINKKANETSNIFLHLFFDELENSIMTIEVAHLKKLFCSLFSIMTLKNPQYFSLIENEGQCLYISFIRRFKSVSEKIIASGEQGYIDMILEIVLEKFSLITDPYSLKSLKFKEEMVKQEFQIAKQIVLYYLTNQNSIDPSKMPVQKLCKCLKQLNIAYVRLEQTYDLKVEAEVSPENQFSTVIFNHLHKILDSGKDNALTLRVLELLLELFEDFSQKLESCTASTKLSVH